MKKNNKITAEEYRTPMLIKTYKTIKGYNYPECPRCGTPTERDYQKFCSYCGQKLKWNFSKMKLHK